jgi:hypothetical protein
MQEPSDGIAEELERQLQLALAAAAIAARRAIAAREQAIQQSRRESDQAARAAQARVDAERLLATERLRPVFDDAWWETAGPREIAGMWQEASSWRDPDQDTATPTIFDRAVDRIGQEMRDRSGLDPSQVLALAAVQELEREHQATLATGGSEPAELAAAGQDARASRGFDDPQRREQLRQRLAAAGVPEPAIDARTLADLGQAREAAQAAQTPVETGAATAPAPARRGARELRRQR